MVWGMALPKEFGAFWPSGDFENGHWYDRLTAHHWKLPADEQKALYDYHRDDHGASHSYGFFASKKLTKEPGTTGSDHPALSPMRLHEAPASFNTEKTLKEFGSLIMLNDGILAVGEGLREVIQRLEPDMHQFFAIDIVMPKGVEFPRRYYTLLIRTYLDSFSPELSKIGSWREHRPGLIFYDDTKKGSSGLALEKAKFGGAHLWRERAFGLDMTCLSDELQATIAESGLKIPRHHRMTEV